MFSNSKRKGSIMPKVIDCPECGRFVCMWRFDDATSDDASVTATGGNFAGEPFAPVAPEYKAAGEPVFACVKCGTWADASDLTEVYEVAL